MHDKSVCQDGTYDRAVAAIKLAKSKGFRTQINCTLFDGADPERTAKFFDEMMAMGVDGMTVSPGYAYERAPDQQHFLNRERTKKMFREILARGNGGKNWEFTNSSLFMDFLAGNQTYECTPLVHAAADRVRLAEALLPARRRLCEDLQGADGRHRVEKYGVGKYEKCANCMVHCGFEGTAATDAIKHPLKMLPILMKGIKTEGEMAPEIDLSRQRPAEFTFSRHVEHKMSQIRAAIPTPQRSRPAE